MAVAFVAQSVERVLGKNEVSGSIPDKGSLGLLVNYVGQSLERQDTEVVKRGSL